LNFCLGYPKVSLLLFVLLNVSWQLQGFDPSLMLLRFCLGYPKIIIPLFVFLSVYLQLRGSNPSLHALELLSWLPQSSNPSLCSLLMLYRQVQIILLLFLFLWFCLNKFKLALVLLKSMLAFLTYFQYSWSASTFY
jgi:hypothetical protein